MAHAANQTSVTYECNPAALWMRLIGVGISAVVIVVGGIGNFTTLIAFTKNSLLRNYHNINIFCMAVNDFVMNVYICGHFAEKFWLGCWKYSTTYCHFYTVVDAMTFYASLVFVALIAYDRFLMVKHGALYQQKESVKTVSKRIMLFIMWPILAGLATGLWPQITGIQVNVAGVCMPEIVQSVVFYQLMTWLGLVGPLVSMLLCYISIFQRRRKLIDPLRIDLVLPSMRSVANAPTYTQQQHLLKQRRAVRTFNVLFATVLITTAPYALVTIIASLIVTDAAPSWINAEFWMGLYDLTFPISWLSGAINPLLYAHTMPEYKKTMGNVWRPLINWLTSLRKSKLGALQLIDRSEMPQEQGVPKTNVVRMKQVIVQP